MRFLILVICSLIAATHQMPENYDARRNYTGNYTHEYKLSGFVPFSGVNDLPCFKVTDTLQMGEDGVLVQLGLLESTQYIASFEPMMFQDFNWVKLAYRWYQLYDYLMGNNEAGMKFPKTNFQQSSFVKMPLNNGSVEEDSMGVHIYKFFIGNQYTDLPRPLNPNVHLVQEAPTEMAAITVGGYPEVSDMFYFRDRLLEALGDRVDEYDSGALIVSGFDAIWKFWDRKNTIMILKKGWQAPTFPSNATLTLEAFLENIMEQNKGGVMDGVVGDMMDDMKDGMMENMDMKR
jgi:hypothetical protein